MRQLWKTVLAAVVAVGISIGCISPAHTQKPEIIWHLRLDEVYNKPFIDRNKNWKNDKQRCWEKAVLNMIEFAVPEAKPKVLEKQLRELVPEDVGFDGFRAMKHLFKKNLKNEDIPIIRIDATTVDQRTELNTWIMGSILKHQIVYLNVVYPNERGRSHALVVYGYEIDSNADLFLFYVDSDDKKHKMHREKVMLTRNGHSYFGSGEYIGWKFNLAMSLDMIWKYEVKY